MCLEVLLRKIAWTIRDGIFNSVTGLNPFTFATNSVVNLASTLQVAKAIASNPAIVKARPSVNLFFCQYLRKFRVINVNGNLVVHSHLPPLNSPAYKRFVRDHLLGKVVRPSHAQIGVTDACPQHCDYCYNKGRSGDVMDTEEILGLIRDLKNLGVFWIGLTGGEPLLNRDLVTIVESIGSDCASKIFTTGCGLTKDLALDLQSAGLTYVTISLDHWSESEHDIVRKFKGAYRAALKAVETFLGLKRMHVSVSAVVSKEMIARGDVERFLQFLSDLGIHEAWLSETKPAVEDYWRHELVITEDDRMALIGIQDRWNRRGGMTVNYLSHFEDAQHFGCTAGHKMVYVDAFGYVSPCVFIPMTFGNIRERSMQEIVAEMLRHFPGENTCFINKNFEVVRKYYDGISPIGTEQSRKIMNEVEFGPRAKFFALQYK